MGLLLSGERCLNDMMKVRMTDLMSFLPQASSQSLRPLFLVKEFEERGRTWPRQVQSATSTGSYIWESRWTPCKYAIISERPWILGEVPKGWRKANVGPILKKRSKLWSEQQSGPLKLPSVTGKITEWKMKPLEAHARTDGVWKKQVCIYEK